LAFTLRHTLLNVCSKLPCGYCLSLNTFTAACINHFSKLKGNQPCLKQTNASLSTGNKLLFYNVKTSIYTSISQILYYYYYYVASVLRIENIATHAQCNGF
jgi:hypothetical protein